MSADPEVALLNQAHVAQDYLGKLSSLLDAISRVTDDALILSLVDIGQYLCADADGHFSYASVVLEEPIAPLPVGSTYLSLH